MSGLEPAEEFLDHAPCGLIATSPLGLILSVNGTFLEWTGFAREDLVGNRRLDELFTLPCRIHFDTHFAPLLRIQGFVNEVAIDLVRRDGQSFPAFLNATEKRDAQGNPELIRVALFDGRDRRKYERELLLARRNSEQAVKAKADFLAMFAHELRNPLGAVIMQTNLLQRQIEDPESQKGVERLRRMLDRVLILLNNMLEISRLKAGKVSLEKVPFAPADLVQVVIQTLSPQASAKGVALLAELDPELPRLVLGDPVKLEQVLMNLAGNALKFTLSGSVTTRIERVAQFGEFTHLRFEVRDTGIGIPRERQAAVLEEYTQADQSIAERFGGTGLGLAITRKLLEMHGSELRLDSEEGKGSRFWFELRLRAPAEAERGTDGGREG